MEKKKVAFICVHNSCRSQIAEALGKYLAGDPSVIVPFSGEQPSWGRKLLCKWRTRVICQETYHTMESMDREPKPVSVCMSTPALVYQNAFFISK